MKGRDKLYQINKKNKIAIIVIVIIIVLAGYYFFIYKSNENIIENESFLSVNEIKDSKSNNVIENQEMYVYVSGAVNSPGVIQIYSGFRVIDAIEKAGGVKENADLTKINLAEKIEDEKKIFIPEIGENRDEGESYGEKEKTQRLSVNINTANGQELQKLPGIGASLADSIIEYRKQNGKFSSIEDIKKVSGIGENKFNKIKEYIKI